MSPRVLYRDAQGRTGEVSLEPNTPCYIGRALDCAVRTDDAMVSRKHSLIRMDSGRYLVEDLGSSNGTHVNDIKVSRQTLNHNDVVRCGNLWLRYIDEGPSDGTPAQPADGAGSSSKYRNTLGGGGSGPKLQPQPPEVSPRTEPSPPPAAAQPPPTPPPVVAAGPSGIAATIMRPDGQPPATAVKPQPPPTIDPDMERPGIPPTVIRPDSHAPVGPGGKPLPRRQQSPHATPISPTPPSNAAHWETDPVGSMPREELERRLEIATARAHELERGLLTLQAELETAQQKIKTLLLSVRELIGLKS